VLVIYVSEQGKFAWSAEMDTYVMYHDKYHRAVLLTDRNYDITRKIALAYRNKNKVLTGLFWRLA
jgi:hypothetical protein